MGGGALRGRWVGSARWEQGLKMSGSAGVGRDYDNEDNIICRINIL